MKMYLTIQTAQTETCCRRRQKFGGKGSEDSRIFEGKFFWGGQTSYTTFVNYKPSSI